MEVYSLFVAMVSLYVSYYYGKKQTSQPSSANFKNYLLEISSSLKEMAEKLAKNEIPTQAGNKLSQALENFKLLSSDLKKQDKTRQDLEKTYLKLKKHLFAGKFLDDVIRGYIIKADEKKKSEMLSDMLRTSGFLEGIAIGLKV